MPIFPSEYLHHILDEANFIKQESSQTTHEAFLKSEVMKRSFVRSLEIIGEAVKKLPPDFKSENRNVNWKAIAGMRDKLIHDYFGVDYDIVWDVALNKIPELIKKINPLLKNK